jgi:AraC-like DNA-binding protein
MLETQHRIHAAAIPVLQQLCASEGMDLDMSDPVKAKLDFNGTSISNVRFATLLETLNGNNPEGGIGRKLASQFQLGDTGLFGLAMMNAPSFHHALEFFARFLPLVADHSSFESSLGSQNAYLEWHYSPFLQHRNEYIDFCIALSLRQFAQFHPQGWKPLSVSLQRSKAEHTSKQIAAFSNIVRLDCESHVMEFNPATLRSENPNADHRIFDSLVDLCEVQLSAKTKVVASEGRMKEFILQRLQDNALSLETLAKHVGMEPRTLQRKLSMTGQSFAKLVSDVQKEYSDFLLLETHDTFDVISTKLGFSSTASYSRVAHQWYGVPASQLRSKLN